jgi:hypothetical protein
MKTKYVQIAVLLIVAIAAVLAPQLASAAQQGTASSTQINNKASLLYTAGTITQTVIESSPTGNTTAGVGAGTNTSFYVANKVNPVVASLGNTSVLPGSTSQVLTYTITNMGNTTQRYALSTSASGTAPTTLHGSNGIYANDGVTAYVDASTFGDIASGNTITVKVLADTSLAGTNGQTETFNLIATTVNAGTLVPTTATSGAANLQNSGANVDVVFADAAGSADGANDGKHSASGVYTVSAPMLTVTKTTAVYSDPVNGTTNPKAIPQAVMTYTITIANAAGAGQAATSVTITDPIPTNTTFKAQFNDGVTTTCTALQGIVVGGACKTNTNDGDGADYNLTTAGAVTVSGLSIGAGSNAVIKFQVTIN